MRETPERRRRRRSVILFLSVAVLLFPLAACGSSGKKSATARSNDPRPLTIVSAGQAGSSAATRHKHLSGIVYLDPGHGGVDTGTSGYTSDGTLVYEKTVVLQIALRLAQQLRADGLTVVMTRDTDADPCITPGDLTADGMALTAAGVLADLQCRIDKANAAKAQVFLSLHMNAYSDPSVSGTETFYDSVRPFAQQNKQFADLVQQNIINSLRNQGYSTPDRGVTADSQIDAEGMGTLPSTYNHLVVLGPAVPGQLNPSLMPGALTEIFFLSNPSEATAIIEPGVQNIIAGALTNAIETFLQQGG